MADDVLIVVAEVAVVVDVLVERFVVVVLVVEIVVLMLLLYLKMRFAPLFKQHTLFPQKCAPQGVSILLTRKRIIKTMILR